MITATIPQPSSSRMGHRHASQLLRVQRNELGPDLLPVVGAQFAARDSAFRCQFDGDAPGGRARTLTARPSREVWCVALDQPAEQRLSAALDGQVLGQIHVRDFSAPLIAAQAPRELPVLATRYAIHGMTTVDDIRRENLRALATSHGGPRGLAQSLQRSESQVSQWLNASRDSKSGKPRRISSDSCRYIEKVLSKPIGWMDAQHRSAGTPNPQQAHDLSHFKPDDAPTLQWGAMMVEQQLPHTFWVTLPDDSMAPRAPAGKRICFELASTAKPGDGVLVRDRTGAVYFRRMVATGGGLWFAQPLNPNYATLESERDGLALLAVLIAERGGWA